MKGKITTIFDIFSHSALGVENIICCFFVTTELVSMLHFISRSIFSDNFHVNATDFVIKVKTSVIDQLSFSFEPEVMEIALHSHLHI